MTYFYLYNILVKSFGFTSRMTTGEFMKDLHISILNDIYGALLTEKQRDIVRDYYDCDLSLSEIAESDGISRQAVSDTVRTSEKILCRYEEMLGFASKLSDIRSEAEKISGLISEGRISEAKAAADKLISEL